MLRFQSAVPSEVRREGDHENNIVTSKAGLSYEETVINPCLQVDGGDPAGGWCSGCEIQLYGMRYTCQECSDFYFCWICMESALQPHSEHRFRSSAHDAVFLRKHVAKFKNTSNDASKESNAGTALLDCEGTEDTSEEPEPSLVGNNAGSPTQTYLTRTRYRYVYLHSSGDVIGELSSFIPRLPLNQKSMGHNTPIIEKITNIDTNLPKGASQAEMQAVHFDSSPLICRVSVNSPMLLNVLRVVVAYYPGWSLGDQSLLDCRCDGMLSLLSHHRHQLLQYESDHPPTHSAEYVRECNAHIDEIIRFLDSETGPVSKRFEDQLCADDPVVTYDQLGMLFKPGQEVFAWIDEQLGAFVISEARGNFIDDLDDDVDYFFINAWNIDFDGIDFGRAWTEIHIKRFKDEQKVRSLPCFPTSLGSERWGDTSTRQRLIERGKKFFQICKNPAYMECTGYTRDLPRRKYSGARLICDASCEPWREATHRPSNNGAFQPYHGKMNDQRHKHTRPNVGAFMHETLNSFSGCACENCKKLAGPAEKPNPYGQWDKINRSKAELDEQQYFMCRGQVYGYILKERQWRLLNVEDLAQPKIERNLINQLVLEDESTKDLIKAICSRYTSRGAHDTYSADFIQGKGEGNIFLLHGPPGVGKTLTAGRIHLNFVVTSSNILLECVAEYTARPLLPLTGGDIGSTASEVENNLRNFLRRGQDWNAVVLLDEADVYLSARDGHSIERNSVVSVFLREIEYYRGILFLTTNQIGQFDEAIISRVHISLHFKPFDPRSRRKIWENNLERLRKERKDIKIDYNVLKFVKNDLLNQNWNGREIRNAFQTAVSLALFAARDNKSLDVELTMDHIQQVVDMSNNFKTYIDSTLDADAATRAKFNKIRNDEFTVD